MIRQRPSVIANQIRLQRSQYTGPFIVVEGRDDRLFLKQFIKTQSKKIVVAETKVHVCETVRILYENNFGGVVGLVDADFDHLVNSPDRNQNIIVTNLHDLECIQLQSSGLESIVSEYGSQDKVDKFDGDLRDTLLRAASPIGHLRLYCHRNNLSLRFNGLNYSDFIGRFSLETDRNKLIDAVKKRSNRLDLSNASLADAIRDMESLRYDLWQICTGEDLLGVLSIALRYTIGSNDAKNVGRDRLRGALRLAYSKEEFHRSDIKNALQEWERLNEGFEIFSNDCPVD